MMAPVVVPPTDLISIVRGEYLEMPGLNLTPAQAQRLWGLDASTCGRILDALVQDRFLSRTNDGRFILCRSAA